MHGYEVIETHLGRYIGKDAMVPSPFVGLIYRYRGNGEDEHEKRTYLDKPTKKDTPQGVQFGVYVYVTYAGQFRSRSISSVEL